MTDETPNDSNTTKVFTLHTVQTSLTDERVKLELCLAELNNMKQELARAKGLLTVIYSEVRELSVFCKKRESDFSHWPAIMKTMAINIESDQAAIWGSIGRISNILLAYSIAIGGMAIVYYFK